MTGKTITTIEVRVDSPDLNAHPDPLPGGPELCLGHTVGTIQKVSITVGKIHGHDKFLLPYLKPEKAAKILSELPSYTTSINQQQRLANISIRRGVGKTGVIMKTPGINPLLKPKVCLQSHHIQRPKGQPRSEINAREVAKKVNISHLRKHAQLIISPSHKILHRDRCMIHPIHHVNNLR